MTRRAAFLAVLAAAFCLVLLPGAAPAKKPWSPKCHASTKLGDRPHQLVFRVHCNFQVDDITVEPEAPAVVRSVRRDPHLRGGEAQDHVVCKREDNAARCTGEAGHEVTVVGALRMRGNRCDTATRFGIMGGADCEDGGPGTACPAIGYFANLRDPEPAGCG